MEKRYVPLKFILFFFWTHAGSSFYMLKLKGMKISLYKICFDIKVRKIIWILCLLSSDWKYVLIQRNNFFSVNERTEICACFYGYFKNKNLLVFWSKEYISFDCVFIYLQSNQTKVKTLQKYTKIKLLKI